MTEPWTDGIFEKVRSLALESAELALEGAPTPHLDRCESHIERLFLCALWMRGYWKGELDFSRASDIGELVAHAQSLAIKVPLVATQVRVGKFRTDFLLAQHVALNEPTILVAVECDGHDFHEKTKEQAARDKARDREITMRGVHVLRYTGSEIWRDAGACADQVLGHMHSEYGEIAFRDFCRTSGEAA